MHRFRLTLQISFSGLPGDRDFLDSRRACVYCVEEKYVDCHLFVTNLTFAVVRI
jgi:hypothetical protein